ncbi:MAG: ABC transporter permease [Bacteroidales bacterium]|nr:ABC transporter permease [Bacteroidales bacterium]
MKQTPKILNLLGLATALAVFMILMAQVRYDRRYNRCLADSERMYRVEENDVGQGFSDYVTQRNLAAFLSSQEEVEAISSFHNLYGYDYYMLHNPAKDISDVSFIQIYDTDFFAFFGFECVAGDFAHLDTDHEAVLPKSLADKLFPKGNAIGDYLEMEYRDKKVLEPEEDTLLRYRVVAVYQDLPENNSIGNPVIFFDPPRLSYEIVSVNRDSLNAHWPWSEPFDYWVSITRMESDTLFTRLHLYDETEKEAGTSLIAGSNINMRTKAGHTKMLRLRASMDSTDQVPVIVKAKMEKPDPVGCFYVKLKSGTSEESLAERITAHYEWLRKAQARTGAPVVRLVAAKDIRFETDVESDHGTVSRFVTNCLAGIAWAVLIIAFLNFANFAIAEAPLRMRRVNTRKVLGESDGGIWWSMAKSYIILSLVAFLIAFLVFLLCTRLPEIPMLTNPVTLSGNVPVILTTLLLSIVVGVVVSIYPTRMVTVVSPDVALKGNYGFSKTGIRLRTLFIGLQFFLASVILTCTLYVAVQNRYLKQYDMGFQTHNVLNFSADVNFQKTDEFATALKKLPSVSDVTFASHNILRQGYSIFGRPMWTADGDSATNAIFNVMSVAPNFLNFFGIKIADGIPFEKCDTADTLRYVIFNRKAQEQYHLQLNWYYNFSDGMMKTQIVGFSHDFHFRPLYDTIQPMALELASELGMMTGHFFVKYDDGADTAALVQGIRRLAHDFGDDDELKINTLEQDSEKLYSKEAGLSKGMFILCGIAVLLALMGVAGMLLLEMTYRRPELGLRQIFGSSTGQLLARANGKYTLLCSVAFLLSVPVSIVLLRQWLKLFVAHAPIAVWIFLLAYVILLALTVLVVTVQSALSLRFDPVETVRT